MTLQTTEQLLPCGRCGSLPVVDHGPGLGDPFISCPAILYLDGEETPCGCTAHGAGQWNTRADAAKMHNKER